MTTGYDVEILETTDLTLAQKTDLLNRCKIELVIEHSDFDTLILNAILAEIKKSEAYTCHFLYLRKVKVSVQTAKGIFDLPYMPVAKTPIPVFSDSQAVVFDSVNSLLANSDVPVSLTYWAGFDKMPEDFESVIFQSVRISLDTEKGSLNHLQKVQALKELRELYLSNYRLNAVITSYV
jgi:hypothetical protein